MTDLTNVNAICPAARLAREAAKVLTAHAKAEAAGQHEAAEDLAERREAIETEASFVRATSALGAFFQALTLFGEADEQNVWFADDGRARQGARRMQRLAASIGGYLEGAADAATVETLRGFYLRRENEPSTLPSIPLDAAA